jgi:hypothetical protein
LTLPPFGAHPSLALGLFSGVGQFVRMLGIIPQSQANRKPLGITPEPAVTDSVACAVKLMCEEVFTPEQFFRSADEARASSRLVDHILKDGPGVRSMSKCCFRSARADLKSSTFSAYAAACRGGS